MKERPRCIRRRQRGERTLRVLNRVGQVREDSCTVVWGRAVEGTDRPCWELEGRGEVDSADQTPSGSAGHFLLVWRRRKKRNEYEGEIKGVKEEEKRGRGRKKLIRKEGKVRKVDSNFDRRRNFVPDSTAEYWIRDLIVWEGRVGIPYLGGRGGARKGRFALHGCSTGTECGWRLLKLAWVLLQLPRNKRSYNFIFTFSYFARVILPSSNSLFLSFSL